MNKSRFYGQKFDDFVKQFDDIGVKLFAFSTVYSVGFLYMGSILKSTFYNKTALNRLFDKLFHRCYMFIIRFFA